MLPSWRHRVVDSERWMNAERWFHFQNYHVRRADEWCDIVTICCHVPSADSTTDRYVQGKGSNWGEHTDIMDLVNSVHRRLENTV